MIRVVRAEKRGELWMIEFEWAPGRIARIETRGNKAEALAAARDCAVRWQNARTE